jgi:regulator of replication initiation timing
MDMDDYDKECFDRIQRIAELEAENSRLLAERARFCTERNWECNEKLAAVERIAELEAKVERLTVDGIHTCHDHCQRPMCVLRRENEELRKRLEEMSDEHRNN